MRRAWLTYVAGHRNSTVDAGGCMEVACKGGTFHWFSGLLLIY